MKRALLALFFTLCLCAQAFAFTITSVATGSSTTGNSLSLGSGLTVSAGDLIYVSVFDTTANIGSVADGVSPTPNTYNSGSVGLGPAGFYFYYASGGIIQAIKYTSGNFAGNTNIIMSITRIQGSNGVYDASYGNSNFALSGPLSVVGATTAAVAGEINIVTYGYDNTSAFTQSSGWTTPPNSATISTTYTLAGGHIVNGGTSDLTNNSTIAVSTGWAGIIDAFEPTSGPPPSTNCTIQLLGAGPC